MKISVKQILVVLLAMLGSFGLLKGGEWLYVTTAVKTPLVQTMGAIPGVRRAELTAGGNVVVTLMPSADLMVVYHRVDAVATQTLGHPPRSIEIRNWPNPTLTQLANNVRFVVAQGEATGQYVAMKNAILAAARAAASQATVEMGNSHLYITLRQGAAVVYQVIPLELGGVARG